MYSTLLYTMNEKCFISNYILGAFFYTALIGAGWLFMPSPHWSDLLFILILPAAIPAFWLRRRSYVITLLIGYSLSLAMRAMITPEPLKVLDVLFTTTSIFVAAGLVCELIHRMATDQRNKLQDIYTAHALFHKLFEATPIALACLDRNFSLILANRLFNQMFDSGDEGASYNINFAETQLYRHIRDALITVRDSGKPYSAHAEPMKNIISHDPPDAIYEWRLLPILDHQGEVEYILLKILDVTERVQTEEELQNTRLAAERQRVMIESFGAASHHLSQPITVIAGNLNLLQQMKRCKDDPQLQRIIHNCQSATNQLYDLLDRLQNSEQYISVKYTKSTSITDLWKPSAPKPDSQDQADSETPPSPDKT